MRTLKSWVIVVGLAVLFALMVIWWHEFLTM
jgi:hypothetical protein